MESYKYISTARITKGNQAINEDRLGLLSEKTLAKAIQQKIIKKLKPQKNGSNKNSNIEGDGNEEIQA